MEYKALLKLFLLGTVSIFAVKLPLFQGKLGTLMLRVVIETEIQNLGSLSSGSDEKSKAIQNLATLHKLRIEEIKAETEAEEKRERRVMDSEQRKAELALKEKQATQQVGSDLSTRKSPRGRSLGRTRPMIKPIRTATSAITISIGFLQNCFSEAIWQRSKVCWTA